MGQTEFVTDTNALIFAAAAPKRLSKPAKTLFDRVKVGTAVVHVPAPVSMEIWFLSINGRIKLPSTLAAWWRDAGSDGIIHQSCTHDDVLAAAALSWDHRDVYDRMIVAIARRLGLPLVTSDAVIADCGLVEVVW